MEIYVVRHGQTDWNIQDKLQGHTNVPLNKVGINQAYITKENLDNINFSDEENSDIQQFMICRGG